MARKRVVPVSIAEVEHLALVLAKKWMLWDEPIPDFKTRYPNRLESCLSQPFIYFNQKPLYPRLIDKVAIMFYLMVRNHPFFNGNKRIAVTTLFVFLDSNEKWLRVVPNDLYKIAVFVAESKTSQKDAMVLALQGFLKKHIISTTKIIAKTEANETSVRNRSKRGYGTVDRGGRFRLASA